MKKLSLLTFSLLFMLTACDKANIELITEEVFEKEPEVVYTKGALNYRLGQESLYDGNGYGALTLGVFYTISSDSIECVDDGGFQIALTSENAYVFNFLGDNQGGYTFANGYFKREYEGEERIVVLRTDCPGQQINLEITDLNEESVSGKFSGIGYIKVVDDNLPNCEDYLNIGVVEVDFSVPLTQCN